MLLILHIFNKDVRCLWKEILASLAALALLTEADVWRYDYMPMALDGVMNLLVPAAWFLLIAMLVQQESLSSDRQFWLSWPYPWKTLVAAKLLFAAAFIHLPYLISNAIVLVAHGFSPLEFLGVLLWKQAVLAAVLTVPAIALAAVTRNLPQFLLTAIAVLAVGFVMSGGAQRLNNRLDHLEMVRLATAGGALLLVSAAIVLIQYPFRRLMLSRVAGLAGLACCALLATMLPVDKHQSRLPPPLRPAHRLPLEVAIDPQGALPGLWGRPSKDSKQRMVLIPLRLITGPVGLSAQMKLLHARLAVAGGPSFEVSPSDESCGTASVSLENRKTGMLQLCIDGSVYERIRNSPLSVVVDAEATVVTDTALLSLPALNGSAFNSEIGHCQTSLTDIVYTRRQLKLFCESPRRTTGFVPVKLVDQKSGKSWRRGLSDGWTFVDYPTRTWLSPLTRSQTFFDLQGDGSLNWGDYMVPDELLGNSTISVLKLRVEDYGRTEIRGEGITLSQFRVLPPRH